MLMERMRLRREYLWIPHLSKRDLYARVLKWPWVLAVLAPSCPSKSCEPGEEHEMRENMACSTTKTTRTTP